MNLKKLIKKINKENAPPGGWKEVDKLTSSQAQRRKTRGRKLRVGPPEKSPSPQAPRSGSQGTSAQALVPGNRQQG